ncbi:hypothetical protein AML91_16125 [Paenibacillus jilunlii]|uniref:Uncharacterized protein n=1 Tax=Paenibacillus jilunlii TaxID=682956 RepID=A0ABR5STD2_9BACL|nr:hypothetical protein AML91_16125 [Paenibacillus jilunlii]
MVLGQISYPNSNYHLLVSGKWNLISLVPLEFVMIQAGRLDDGEESFRHGGSGLQGHQAT